MKKVLLAMAALAATVCGAQAADYNLLTKSSDLQAYPCEALQADDAQSVAAQAPARVAKKASKTIDEICGSYVYSQTYLDTTLTGGGSAVITKVSSDSVSISGLYAGGAMTAAYVGDTIYIPSQVNYTSSTYGTASLVCLFYQDGTLYYSKTRPVKAVVRENGDIDVVDMAMVRIDSGSYEGYYLGHLYDAVSLKIANGTMDITYNKTISSTKTDTSFPVYVEQPNDSTVTVLNFANLGKEVTITLAEDSTIQIAQQLVYNGGTTAGDYYTYAADYSSGSASITSKVIAGTGTEDALSWGSWVLYSTNKYWTGAMATGKVSYTNGNKFVFPSTTGINEVNTNKQAVSTTYFNVAGQQSAVPFNGVNIVVTRYDDGTSHAAKIMR